MKNIYVPPGGFAAAAQQTPAGLYAQGAGRKTSTPRKRKRYNKRGDDGHAVPGQYRDGPRKRRKKSAKRRGAKLVKGSAAAKRYMASIRKKRRK